VDPVAFEHHLTSPQGRGHTPDDAVSVTAGGGACCDSVTFALRVVGDRVVDAGFSAEGCGAATAAGSAAVTLARGRPVRETALIGAREIAGELGGLSPGKLHAAELAADALARALGSAVRAGAGVSPPPRGSRTLVAMSGGVDSAVAALLCREHSETVAVTLELWSDRENDAERSCCSASAVAQARSLAHSLGIPHLTVDLRSEFRHGVVDPFIAGYAMGETPNPCVGCNGHVRLDAMLELARRMGCDALATGHYARVTEHEHPDGPLLRTPADKAKDQTYMLAALAPSSLARMRFPLGELRKPEVRELAAAAGLPVADKRDSQDLCFLAGTTRARFLARHGDLSSRPGAIEDADGRTIGTHLGHAGFTVGQRRGLGVAVGDAMFVVDKDAASNRVIVGPRNALLTRIVKIRQARLHRDGGRVDRVKLRYRSEPVRARLVEERCAGQHATITVALEDEVYGAAPGQLACLMDGELVIGWGTISRTQHTNHERDQELVSTRGT
jgi:tRNA-specific 2-thiouridylase